MDTMNVTMTVDDAALVLAMLVADQERGPMNDTPAEREYCARRDCLVDQLTALVNEWES